jgi:hypothetical protein
MFYHANLMVMLYSAEQVLYLLVASLGIGVLFQSPLIALQAAMPLKDMATSTATFGLLRTLGGTVGISVGQAILTSVRDLSSYGKPVLITLLALQELSKKISKIKGITGIDTSAGGLSQSVREIHKIPVGGVHLVPRHGD